jgi:anti-sigma regulatory factor (Ser/Thr protein kinase)/biotin operon repressor
MVDNRNIRKVDNRQTKPAEEKIRNLLSRKGITTGAFLAAELGISRQALHKHLKKMISKGEVLRLGITRGASYRLRQRREAPVGRQLQRKYKLKELQEDRIFEECALWLNLKRQVSQSAYDIVKYAFTEMLNNAIDHSRSKECLVSWVVGTHDIRFSIRDFGIGLFYSIETKLGLQSETEALGELLKGKTTTMKERHAGEGIYFTSRVGDLFTIDSHRIRLDFDNRKKDVSVAQRKLLKGTNVSFEISKNSKRNLATIFSEYAPEQYNYRFEKTRVRVELLASDFVSRSEARRLLRGLEKFHEVILDFKKVKSIGQAFADEVFRVFPSHHPSITIRTANANPIITMMIRHVQKSS